MTVEERKRQIYFLVNETEPEHTKFLGSDTISALNKAFSQSMESQHRQNQRLPQQQQTQSRRRRRNPHDLQFLHYVPSGDSSSLRQRYNRVEGTPGASDYGDQPPTPGFEIGEGLHGELPSPSVYGDQHHFFQTHSGAQQQSSVSPQIHNRQQPWNSESSTENQHNKQKQSQSQCGQERFSIYYNPNQR